MKLDELVDRVKEKSIGRNVRDEVIDWGRKNKVLVSDFVELSGDKGLDNCEKVKERLVKEGLWNIE